MRFMLGKTEEGKQCCPHCKSENIKLVYSARIVIQKKLLYAFRCSQCRKIVWLKN